MSDAHTHTHTHREREREQPLSRQRYMCKERRVCCTEAFEKRRHANCKTIKRFRRPSFVSSPAHVLAHARAYTHRLAQCILLA